MADGADSRSRDNRAELAELAAGETPEVRPAPSVRLTVRRVERLRPRIVSVGLDKQAHKRKYKVPWPAAPWVFNLLCERIDGMLAGEGVNQQGMLIADSGGKDAGQATRLLRIFQNRGTMLRGKVIHRVIDNLHFVDSVHSPEIQIADVCGYFLRRRAERCTKSTKWQERVQRISPRLTMMP